MTLLVLVAMLNGVQYSKPSFGIQGDAEVCM